jgi:HK97 family phage major capsid protein
MKVDIKLLMRKKDELLQKRQEILDKAVEEERGYTDEEREEVKRLQGEVSDFDEQIREAQEIERQRAGAPPNQPTPSVQSGDPAPVEAKFKNLGHFVRDIWRARTGDTSELMRQYVPIMEKNLRAMNISDGTSLGFLIPDTFEAGTLQLTGADGWIRKRARVIPAGEYPDAKFKKRVLKQGAGGVYNGIMVNYTGEGVAPVDESKLEYYLFALDPSDKKIAMFYITSDESLNNPTSVTADMEQSFRGALAELEDDLFINGDGVGKPLGILNSGGIRLIDRDTSSDFKFADVIQLAKYMYPRAVNRNWEITLDLYDKVGQMADAQSRLIMIAGDATKGIPDLLHGRPIHWSEVLPAAGSRGDVILADWSFYYIKDGSGPFFATDPYTRFLEGEIRVKMTVKMDGDTWIKEPLTLKNGMEVSPFVVLEA